MRINVKKLHPDAVLPKSATPNDAGYDLVALDDGEMTDTYIQYRTGIAIEPPVGYHTEIFPRSSISKYDLLLANSVGLVDNGYRGEIMCRFRITPRVKGPSYTPNFYIKGDKIAQLVIRKTEHADFVWVDELSDTTRSTGGFGSTGK